MTSKGGAYTNYNFTCLFRIFSSTQLRNLEEVRIRNLLKKFAPPQGYTYQPPKRIDYDAMDAGHAAYDVDERCRIVLAELDRAYSCRERGINSSVMLSSPRARRATVRFSTN